MPGYQKPVENNNKDFISELNDRYVSLEWFLGKSSEPYLEGVVFEESETPGAKVTGQTFAQNQHETGKSKLT